MMLSDHPGPPPKREDFVHEIELPQCDCSFTTVVRRIQSNGVEVHHLTYERVGYEMLFDLISVCDPCHEQLHRGGEGCPERP